MKRGIFIIFLSLVSGSLFSQNLNKDSIVYNIIYRDSIIYFYDTIKVVINENPIIVEETKEKWYDPNNWWFGPSVGTYYSPHYGFDTSIGVGIWYYFGVSSFKKSHTRLPQKIKGK